MSFLVLAAGIAAFGGGCGGAVPSASFPLEWDARFGVCAPYEVEIQPGKLGLAAAAGFQVVATTASGEKRLATAATPGRAPKSTLLRFRVPNGTTALRAETTATPNAEIGEADNLFAGALKSSAGWSLPKDVGASKAGAGLVFASRAKGTKTVSYTVDLPPDLAGRPVRQEIDVCNRSKLVWAGRIRVMALDVKGKPLPESVVDGRWTDHMRPTDKPLRYRDTGFIHPAAKKLRFECELVRLTARFDAYGRPLASEDDLIPRLEISRLAVCPAQTLPFPKWRDDFFADGVSGTPGDAAFRLGGADERALFYQVHSRGVWTEKMQFRKEEDRYFPAGDGTVEAWFRPEKDLSAAATKPIPLFQAYRYEQHTKEAGEKIGLSYDAAKRTLRVHLCDWAGHDFTGEAKGVALPTDTWTHLALAWTCGRSADLFVNGRRVLALPIAAFEPTPIGDRKRKEPNDLWATEFYLGGTCANVRLGKQFGGEGAVFFPGAVDELRVSSGCRYAADFTPAKDVACDSATRALFKFDRAFDGVSGGGFGFIPACVHAKRDRVGHEVEVQSRGGRRTVRYFPAENVDENDPAKVLTTLNFPDLPTPADYRVARRRRTKSFTLRPGEKASVACGEGTVTDFVEISNARGAKPLVYPILVNLGRLDPRSFGDLADSLGLGSLTDREKVNRVFQYMISSSDYFMNHQADFPAGSDKPQQGCYNAMVVLNGYCGFECGSLNNMTANMFATVAGCPASLTLGYGHLFEEVFFDGKNHIYDLSAQKFFPAMDNETSAYLEEAADQAGVHKRVGRSNDHFIRRSTRGRCSMNPSYQEKFAMTLNPGETMRIWWANDGTMNNVMAWPRQAAYCLKGPLEIDCVDAVHAVTNDTYVYRRDRIFPQYSTGYVTFDGRPDLANPAFGAEGADAFCYRVRSAYPIVAGAYAAWRKDGTAVALEISTDGGRSFRPLRDDYAVKGRHAYLVRVGAPPADIVRFTARTTFGVNTRTYPGWLHAGANELTYKADGEEPADVTFAWREPAQEIVIAGGAYQGTIPGFERQLVLVEPGVPLAMPVAGVSGAAEVTTRGNVRATLKDGSLRLAATTAEPSVAGVEIADRGASKFLTVVIAPNARLVTAAEARPAGADAVRRPADADSCQERVWFDSPKGAATFAYAPLKAGRYHVYALARFASRTEDRGTGLCLVDPAQPKTTHKVVTPVNGTFDFLKAEYGPSEGRGRWKWGSNAQVKGQNSYSGWKARAFDFPETHGLTFRPAANFKGQVELAAVLVIPEPSLDFANDLHHILFGLNCEPLLVK